MPWALVKHWANDAIVKKANRKYDLLKWEVEVKDRNVSKRTMNEFKDGDLITVIYRKTYMKWFRDEWTGRLYQDPFNEVNEVTYTLREFTVSFPGKKEKK